MVDDLVAIVLLLSNNGLLSVNASSKWKIETCSILSMDLLSRLCPPPNGLRFTCAAKRAQRRQVQARVSCPSRISM